MSLLNITENQFKETARYLQEKLSITFKEDIKLSTMQEALARASGFKDYQHYKSIAKLIKTTPSTAKYANGDINIELQSLNFCMKVANEGYGTASYIKAILLHLYNSTNPIDMSCLKGFDKTHTIHMLNVFALNSRANKEIHDYIENGNKIFHTWAEEAQENREWAKHRNSFYEFCEKLEEVEGIKNEDFEEYIKKQLKYFPLESKLETVQVKEDGYYIWKILATDEYNYEYFICIEFNVINGLVYVFEDLNVKECNTGLIATIVNQNYLDEAKEFGDSVYLGYRAYFTKI